MSNETLTPKREKSEAEIAAQITRMAHKLGERAVGLRDSGVLDAADTPDQRVSVFGDQGVAVHEGNKRADITLRPEGASVSKVDQQWGGGDYERGSVNKTVEVSASAGDNGQVSGQYRESTFTGGDLQNQEKQLSKEQNIHVAASILGEIRGKLAHRAIRSRPEGRPVDGRPAEALKVQNVLAKGRPWTAFRIPPTSNL